MGGVRTNRSFHALVAAMLALCATPAQARHHKHKPGPPGFDYYVLSLSWSPQHCAGGLKRAGDLQCATPRRYGFVLHGLWPQDESGYPQMCASDSTVNARIVDNMLDIMPSRELVRHEWSKHGTCSGLSPDAYFAAARGAFAAVKIPAPYDAPTAAMRTNVGEIEQAFQRANPGLGSDAMAVLCNGKFLQEVRVCLDKELHARHCGRDVRNACHDSVVVRPLR